MSSRSSRVRTKVVALLVSLIALWAFAAFVTIRDGVNLLSVNALDSSVGRPTEALVDALQQERRSTLIYVGGHTADQRAALATQRVNTDKEIAAFRDSVDSSTVDWAGSDALDQRITDVLGRLNDLGRTREAVDAGALTRSDAGKAYTATLDAGFLIYGSLATLDDPTIAKDGRTLVNLTRAQEVLAQEDALLSGAVAAAELTATEQAQFVQLVGVQRFLVADAAAELHDADQANFQRLMGSSTFSRFRSLEDALAQRDSTTTALPAMAAAWSPAVEPVISQLREFVLSAADNLISRATPAGVGVIVRLALAGGLGLLAVIASIIISITTARDLVRQLERLRNAARDLASYRLPRVVERLQHGEKVDVENEAPPLDFGNDEIGQVGQAFNDVQSTAVRVAVEQAELRRSVRDVFLSLARRSQALLHRQLGLLDAMERRSTDAEELGELFRIDHLATRMRRNAENLIVLSGATAGRAWRKPVPMVDVLRGALAEVEDYTRVTVLPTPPASLVGRAVGDVIHLLAELIENAVSFSPPQTIVRVGGSVVGNGFAIEIEDRGLGMSDEDRALANEQLNDPPEFKLSSTARLGLYVVGKLAERHGVRVKLTESPYGGTTAIVLLPATLMADGPHDGHVDLEGPSDPEPSEPGDLSAWAALTPGRHRDDSDGGQPALPVRPVVAQTPATPLNGHYTPPAFVTSVPEPVDTPDGVLTSDEVLNGAATAPPAPMPESPVDTGPALVDTATQPADPVVLTPAGLPFRQRDKAPGPVPTAAPAASAPAAPSMPVPTMPVPTMPGTAMAGAALSGASTAAAPTSGASMAGASTDREDASGALGRPSRPPEQVRSIMASYRSGTLRGRIDAARLNDTNPTPEWTDAPPEPHSTDEEG